MRTVAAVAIRVVATAIVASRGATDVFEYPSRKLEDRVGMRRLHNKPTNNRAGQFFVSLLREIPLYFSSPTGCRSCPILRGDPP